ncbi:sensory transduction histidine kinase [Lachnospiraceae bacterium KM106-2]|nr:sensory transduction histidine kinase [Lachnospiraceae bacterium KM106-2]
MKVRYLLITLNLIVAVLVISCLTNINSLKYQSSQMADYNDRYQSIEEGIGSGKSLTTLMKQYHCKIILTKDVGYLKEWYEAINHQDIIFDHMNGNVLIGKIIFERNKSIFNTMKGDIKKIILSFIVSILVLIDLFCAYLYLRIIKPFHKLKHFAGEVALGHLEEPLHMHKHNYFGAFTESFDVMREELKKAREGEYQANLSKRELVASLSHDIKTPVSTIKAVCEILEIKLKDNENVGKIHTIDQKADVIDHLISNLFHATLEELEVLKVNPTEESSLLIKDMLDDMNHYQLIEYVNELPSCLILCDKLRLNQVFDNIISNSYKYANTTIQIRFLETDNHLTIEIRDFGTSASDLDPYLLTEKFYRGDNAGDKNGSGLGLYLANNFIEGMGGELICEVDQGFVVTLHLSKAGMIVKK